MHLGFEVFVPLDELGVPNEIELDKVATLLAGWKALAGDTRHVVRLAMLPVVMNRVDSGFSYLFARFEHVRYLLPTGQGAPLRGGRQVTPALLPER